MGVKSKLKIVIAGIILLVIAGASIFGTEILKKNKNFKECRITFDSNGGTKIDDLIFKCGTKVNAPSNIPTKDGFSFSGWTHMNQQYTFGKIINENITLIANYIPLDGTKIVTITFNSDGGTSVNSIEVMAGKTLTQPIAPIKYGFEFQGWYLDEKKFDFGQVVNNNITLKAKWKKSDKKQKLPDNVKITSSNYKCSGSYASDNQTGELFVGDSKDIHYIFNTSLSYMNDFCTITYKSSDSSVATISSNGEIKTLNDGIIDIYECINDNKTGKELGCFKGRLKVIKRKCEYTIDSKLASYSMSSIINGETLNWSAAGGYYQGYSDACTIKYKTNNQSIASISDKGVITATGVGTTHVYGCIVDLSNQKELDCKSFEVIVYENAENNKKRSEALIKEIAGYYWYLDGYKYAFIRPKVEDWYDHKSLSFDADNIALINNKFVTTEDTNVDYLGDNIHNTFLANPTESAYRLIDEYNMRVSGSKLYITIGGKTYSFTKSPTRKTEKVNITVDKSNIVIDEGETKQVFAKIRYSFFYHNITTTSSNSKVASCRIVPDKVDSELMLECKGKMMGKATITITDSVGGNSAVFDVIVNDVIIPVKGITLSNTTLEMLRGKSSIISAVITPDNADNKNIIWTSSNPAVASVSNGKIMANSVGKATITATTEAGNYSASCVVNVINPALTATASFNQSSITIGGEQIIKKVGVSIKASGGTGSYRYDIQFYKNGELISQVTNSMSNGITIDGGEAASYAVNYIVTDSNGESFSGSIGPITY